jgi:predicted CXXCH cytochrome family protein
MAQSSGRVGTGQFQENFDNGAFNDEASGAEYRIAKGANGYEFRFSKSTSAVEGRRNLEWFVGSGGIGRSYLFSVDGFLFQAPVSYYSSAARWGVSPGYQGKRTIDLTRGVETGCLQCHASRINPVGGMQNRFANPPFEEGGVSCERCHGPGRVHIERLGKGAIVNPAKLEPSRRDSTCAQCHLTGVARIARGSGSSYRPGGLLSNSLAIFVWADAASSELTATSHFEKLQQSRCKQVSGDRLWCGTCHDPHGSAPSAAQSVAYFRSKCLGCHKLETCKRGEDCASCHMPKGEVRAGEHIAFTDHSIPRTTGTRQRPPGKHELVSFWKAPVEERDLALAYAVVALVEPEVRSRAFELLQQAETKAPRDLMVLSQLAQFYDKMGNEESAMALYERMLRIEAGHPSAAANLATNLVQRGRAPEAIALWEKALVRNPAATGTRLNIAVAHYRSGNRAAAAEALKKALDFDPDNDVARKLLTEIQSFGR